MKFTNPGILAIVIFITSPVHAAKEFDCPPAQEVQSQRNETAMSEELLQKRKQARDADMARLRERFMRATGQAQPAGAPEQQATR
jgi:hypothetical protein